MLVIRKIFNDNKNLSLYGLSYILGINIGSLRSKLNKSKDFTIEELEKIKNFLIDNKIIDENFDIGEFLNEIEDKGSL